MHLKWCPHSITDSFSIDHSLIDIQSVSWYFLFFPKKEKFLNLLYPTSLLLTTSFLFLFLTLFYSEIIIALKKLQNQWRFQIPLPELFLMVTSYKTGLWKQNQEGCIGIIYKPHLASRFLYVTWVCTCKQNSLQFYHM